MCGRLRCCLIYEYEQYVEARKQLPKRNKIVGTPYGEGRVTEVFPLRDGVNVRLQDDEEMHERFVSREEIVPLEEFKALRAKAEQGCTRNESGGCDCGASRPKSASNDLAAALELAHQPRQDVVEFGEIEPDAQPVTGSETAGRSRSRRRSRRNRSNRPATQANEAPGAQTARPEQQVEGQLGEHKGDRHRRGRRRRSRAHGHDRQNPGKDAP
jgi:hypothetical protein